VKTLLTLERGGAATSRIEGSVGRLRQLDSPVERSDKEGALAHLGNTEPLGGENSRRAVVTVVRQEFGEGRPQLRNRSYLLEREPPGPQGHRPPKRLDCQQRALVTTPLKVATAGVVASADLLGAGDDLCLVESAEALADLGVRLTRRRRD
jgi:hypothetical protein